MGKDAYICLLAIAGRWTVLTRIPFTGKQYQVTLRLTESTQVITKFDTGAAVSIVSLGLLTTDKNRVGDLVQRARVHGVELVYFESASGHLIRGYYACAENVALGNLRVPRFYFYLVPDISLRKCLLGNDFSKYCDYSHVSEGDILLKDFDYRRYVAACEGKLALNLGSVVTKESHIFG